MKKYYYNTKKYLTKLANNSILAKILIILVIWIIASTPCWLAFFISSLAGVESGLLALLAIAIFLFFAGSFQIALWVLALFLSFGVLTTS